MTVNASNTVTVSSLSLSHRCNGRRPSSAWFLRWVPVSRTLFTDTLFTDVLLILVDLLLVVCLFPVELFQGKDASLDDALAESEDVVDADSPGETF